MNDWREIDERWEPYRLSKLGIDQDYPIFTEFKNGEKKHTNKIPCAHPDQIKLQKLKASQDAPSRGAPPGATIKYDPETKQITYWINGRIVQTYINPMHEKPKC